MLLTHAFALSASQFVHKKKSLRIYTSMHSGGLELTKLTYSKHKDNLLHHRGDRLDYIYFFKRNSHNRVHPEARWPKPGTPFHASPRAPSYWPTPARTRLWPNLKRIHPILAIHPPIGYPISITPTRFWPTSGPHALASSRHCGTRRVIFAVDVVVRAADL